MKRIYLMIAGKIFFAISLLLFSTVIIAQVSLEKISFQGKVVDAASKAPLEGVSVTIKNSRTGTSTNKDGQFYLEAPSNARIILSFSGYNQKEVGLAQDNMTFELAQGIKELNEVVVTATGIKKEARRLGYAIQTIDASKFTQAREADPVSSLKGNVAGLEVNINSEIGHSPDVIIRGENDPNDRPMFVVDGVAISSDTYNINPDDIETVTVLKGPNAAALYGFQGKNGAIIINTKKGSKAKGGPVVSFNSSTQWNKGFIALHKWQDTYGPGDNGKYAYGGGGPVLLPILVPEQLELALMIMIMIFGARNSEASFCLSMMVPTIHLKNILPLLLMEVPIQAT